MSENQEKIMSLVMAAVFLVSAYFLARGFAMYAGKSAETVGEMTPAQERAQQKEQRNAQQKEREVFAELPEGGSAGKFCVIVDAGHGGKDPGKVGVNGVLEKDINLQMANLLKAFLEMDDVRVVMTRETDAGLYDENCSNKKVQDMKRRIALIEEADADLVVSIHQNSYRDSSVKGGQVFYFTTGEKSRQLAQTIQKQLQELQPGNKREAKGNTGYYLLKKTAVPTVIVECGFLSNPEEAQLLTERTYQERMAFGIFMGVMKYLNGEET